MKCGYALCVLQNDSQIILCALLLYPAIFVFGTLYYRSLMLANTSQWPLQTLTGESTALLFYHGYNSQHTAGVLPNFK